MIRTVRNHDEIVIAGWIMRVLTCPKLGAAGRGARRRNRPDSAFSGVISRRTWFPGPRAAAGTFNALHGLAARYFFGWSEEIVG